MGKNTVQSISRFAITTAFLVSSIASNAGAQLGPVQPVIFCNVDASVCGALAPIGTITFPAAQLDGANLRVHEEGIASVTFTNTSITANAGTNLNTSLLALESGGHLASIDAGVGTTLHADLGTIDTDIKATQARSGPPDVTSTCTLTNSGDTCDLAISGYFGVGVTISIIPSWTGTLSFRESSDGALSYSGGTTVVNQVSGTSITSTTAGGQFSFFSLGGVTNVRVRANTISSGGPITITYTKNAATTTSPQAIGGSGQAVPPVINFIGAQNLDSSNQLFGLRLRSSDPGSSDIGLVVRLVRNTASTPIFDEITDGTNPLFTSGNAGYVQFASAQAVTANAGTNLNTSALALETGGNLASIKADTDKIPSQGQAAQASSVPVVGANNGGNPCMSPDAALKFFQTTTSGTAAVEMVAASGSTAIYICSLNVLGVSGTTPKFGIVYGTKVTNPCDTGQTTVLPAFATTAGTLYSFSLNVGLTPASKELCYLDTGTTPVQIVTMTYVQR